MSMSLNVALFQGDNEKLQADYSKLSKDVNVTEFINSFISEDIISEFTALEEGEEVIYKEVDEKSVNELSKKIDETQDDLFIELRGVSGKTKREEIINQLQDLTLLNRLIKIYLLNIDSKKSCLTKILVF